MMVKFKKKIKCICNLNDLITLVTENLKANCDNT